MKKKTLFTIAAASLLLLSSCGEKKRPAPIKTQTLSDEKNEAGDSTVYGLACDGCTDSVLVLLPNAGGDPQTFDIIEAMSKHHIYGMPRVGDKLAVMLSADKKQAVMVVDLNELIGKWCYMVEPTLKPHPGMTARQTKKMDAAMPDSIMKTIKVPREYGFELNIDRTASAVGYHGGQPADEHSPVIYPEEKYYTSWRLFNGRIILTAGNLNITGVKKVKVVNDTAEIVMMRKDTLTLKFKDELKGYYRKGAKNTGADKRP